MLPAAADVWFVNIDDEEEVECLRFLLFDDDEGLKEESESCC